MRISPIIIKAIFSFSDDNNYHNLRKDNHLSWPISHTTHYGTESIINLGAKIWELVPQNIKESDSHSCFRNKMKNSWNLWKTKKKITVSSTWSRDISESITHHHDIGNVVLTFYRIWNDVVCSWEFRDLCVCS